MTRMCCVCNRVEQGGEWRLLRSVPQDARITHGYCPECFAATMVKIEDFLGAKAIDAFGAAGLSAPGGFRGPCA